MHFDDTDCLDGRVYFSCGGTLFPGILKSLIEWEIIMTLCDPLLTFQLMQCITSKKLLWDRAKERAPANQDV